MEQVSAFTAYKKLAKKPAKKVSPKKQNKKVESKQKNLTEPEHLENGNTTATKPATSAKKNARKKKQNNSKAKDGNLTSTKQATELETTTVTNAAQPSKSAKKRKQSENEINEKPSKKKVHDAAVKQSPSPKKTSKDRKNANKSDQQIKTEPVSPSVNMPIRTNSIKHGSKLFKWLIAPIEVDTFIQKFWEKTPCLVERNDPTYFNKLMSFEKIDEMLINNHIEFTKNIDITSYKNGKRETLNPEGRAMPPVVWDHYSNGCSIRLLNPQTYMQTIFALNTTLQEFFHCMVGSNSYLTPPNSQGFAPHYDDIEAFVLQIEGRKRWRLYNPRSKKEELPRFSSENFSQDEIGEPILEKVLMPGDILYFPRGTIHQAVTEPGYHSLHITLSVYQKQSYADLMEKMFPMILQRAIAENVEFRRGLPLSVWHNAGIVFSDVDTPERQSFVRKCRDLISSALKEIPVDQAVDQLAKKYQHEALPPDLTNDERARTVFGSKNSVNAKGQCETDYEIDVMTKVRLLRANILRLVEEEDAIRIYYYVDNSKEYCEYEPNYIEINSDDASSVEVLIKSYPEYVAVNELPLEDDDERKISIVQALWERGLLMFDRPFK